MMKTKKKALLMSLCAMMLVGVSIFGTLAYLSSTTKVVKNTFTVGNVNITLDEEKVNLDGTSKKEGRTDEGNKYHLLPGHTYIKDPTVTVTKNSEESYVRMLVTVEDLDSLKNAIPQFEKNDEGNATDTVIDANKKFYGTYSNGTEEQTIFLLQELCASDTEGTITWDGSVWVFAGYEEGKAKRIITNDDDSTTEVEVKTGVYEFRYVGNDEAGKGTVVKDENKDTTLPALFTHITVPVTVNNNELDDLKNVEIHVVAHAIQADGFANADAAWAAFDAQ